MDNNRNNGSGNIVDNDTKMLARDVESLLLLYAPLRHSMYRQFQGFLPSHASKQDLSSFIDEQFVRLCYEFDVSGNVDFAGYIKIMLKLRVQYSFVGKEYKVRQKEALGRSEDLRVSMQAMDAEYNVDGFSTPDVGLDILDVEMSELQMEFMDFLTSSVTLDELDRDIIEAIFNEDSNIQIERAMYKKYRPMITHADSKLQVREVRDFLKIIVKEWIAINN